MKELLVKCVGVKYKINVPDSVEEYDQAAGKSGACLESGVKNVIYRSTNAQFRSLFADAVETETGIERERQVVGEKTVKDEEGNETTEEVVGFAETEKAYLDRVYAELDLDTEEKVVAEFGELIADVEVKLVFDPSGRDPAAGKTKKAKKRYREMADALVEKLGIDGLGPLAEKLSEQVDYEVEPTPEAIALAVQYREESRSLEDELLGN
jgi:hypothetical protein